MKIALFVQARITSKRFPNKILSEINGKKSGSIGDFSCYSFHAQKNITTLGEGGMLYVKNKNLANKVKGLDTTVIQISNS